MGRVTASRGAMSCDDCADWMPSVSWASVDLGVSLSRVFVFTSAVGCVSSFSFACRELS